jgi:AcrR family transcriptional regulator
MGRPRSAACDNAILEAAVVEYAAGGLEGMSVDAVAARAGVSKATIYRRYPSKVDLVIAAATYLCVEHSVVVDTGSLRGDLVQTLQNLRTLLDDPVFGVAKRRLVSDAMHNDDLARAHRGLVLQRRAATLEMLRRGIERGELRPDADLELATDELGAPVFYRHMLMHEVVDDAYIARLAESFLARYGCVEQPAADVLG